jgi:D-inositol-3-phosphate glycosyltransferase
MLFSIVPTSRGHDRKPLVYMIDSVGEERGMHYYNFSLVSALDEFDIDVVLVSTSETATHPLTPSNVKVRDGFRGIYRGGPRWVRGIRYAFSLLRIGWWAMRDEPQVAHFHFFQIPILDLALILFLEQLGVRVITTIHDVVPFHLGSDLESSIGRIYRRIYSTCSGLILNSAYARNALAQIDQDLLDKATVIPHGDFSEISSRMKRQHALQTGSAKVEIGLEPSVPMVLVFGTIKPNKRLDLALKAMVDVIDRFPDARLIIVGKPQDRDVSQDIQLACQLGVESNVVWRLERVSDRELILYFTAADVLVFPYQWIYQSGALHMAMSLGKAVVATAVGSNVDIIDDNLTGVLVPLDDSDAMSQAIIRLLEDPVLAQGMGDAARDYVATEFSWHGIARSTVAFYREICKGETKDG